MRKIPKSLLIVSAAVVVVFLTSPRLRQLVPGSESRRSAESIDNRLSVSAMVVRPEQITDKVRATGTVIANEEVELRSEATGKIEKILFSEGSRVHKGDLLVKIDDSELRAQLAKLRSEQKVSQEKERRRRLLYEKQSISPEDYEIALNELNAINAEIQLIEAKIQKTELRAPFDGLVGLRYMSEGSYVAPDGARIASLQDVSSVKVDFSVPEKFVGVVKKGQTIFFKVSGQAKSFEGRISAIEPKIDPVTRNVLLRAVSPNEGGKVVPGAFAEVELIVERIDQALMVPTEALVPDLQGHKVYVYRGGVAKEVRVELGLRTVTRVQITSGLHGSDTVLTSGLLQVAPETPVKLREVL